MDPGAWGGATAVICVSPLTANCAGTPLNVTSFVVRKPTPLMTTCVPAVPVMGARPVTCGACCPAVQVATGVGVPVGTPGTGVLVAAGFEVGTGVSVAVPVDTGVLVGIGVEL